MGCREGMGLVEKVVVGTGTLGVSIVSIIIVVIVDLGDDEGKVDDIMVDDGDIRFVELKRATELVEDNELDTAVDALLDVGNNADGLLVLAGGDVGLAVVGIAPEGKKIVVVTKTVVTAFGATDVVEKTLRVRVAEIMSWVVISMVTSVVIVDVIVGTCLFSALRPSASSPVS